MCYGRSSEFRGGGRFQTRRDYKTGLSKNGEGPRSVALGDLDGDRKLDVAIVKSTSVSILLNRTP